MANTLDYLRKRLKGILGALDKITSLPEHLLSRWATGQANYLRREADQLTEAIKEIERGQITPVVPHAGKPGMGVAKRGRGSNQGSARGGAGGGRGHQ